MAPDHSLFCIVQMRENHKHWLSTPTKGGQLIAVELDVHFEEYIPFTEPDIAVSLAGGIPGF
jgi:hypothetical protein